MDRNAYYYVLAILLFGVGSFLLELDPIEWTEHCFMHQN